MILNIPINPLRRYLNANPKIRATQIAKQINITRGHMSLLIHGKRRPSPEVAFRLEAATGISYREFFAIPGGF